METIHSSRPQQRAATQKQHQLQMAEARYSCAESQLISQKACYQKQKMHSLSCMLSLHDTILHQHKEKHKIHTIRWSYTSVSMHA